jgi:hypothetical protein
MINESERIVERHQLENGTEIILYDHTRSMSADRWIVELQCVAYIPVDDSYWNMAAGEDQQILAGIRKKIGDRLTHTFSQKRIFVPEEEREHLLQEMVHQVYSGMMEYLKKPNFPSKLFKKLYHENRQRLLLQQAMDHVADD